MPRKPSSKGMKSGRSKRPGRQKTTDSGRSGRQSQESKSGIQQGTGSDSQSE